MHLHLPLVAGIVALAAGAALVRPHLQAPSSASAALPAFASAPAAASSSATTAATAAEVATSTLGTLNRDAAVSMAGSGPGAGPKHERRGYGGSAQAIVVYVAGDVRRPGLYRLPPRSRADDAVRAAGGARADADLVAVNLAAPIADGDEVAVLATSDAPVAVAHRRSRRATAGVRAAGATATGPRQKRRTHRKRGTGVDATTASDAPSDLIDLNHADASELETLPGIGAALAERIVSVREAGGGFTSADDLLDVGGMTQSRLDALAPYIVVR